MLHKQKGSDIFHNLLKGYDSVVQTSHNVWVITQWVWVITLQFSLIAFNLICNSEGADKTEDEMSGE